MHEKYPKKPQKYLFAAPAGADAAGQEGFLGFFRPFLSI
jgi:hypothetical protein